MAAASPSRSHWYVLVTVGLAVLIPCGWLLVKWHQERMQREAATAIEKAGGHVAYGKPQGPAWLRRLAGDKWFEHIESVTFGSSATDDDLKHLEGLGQLQQLLLVGTKCTDRGLEHLKELAQLRDLSLEDTRITDAGLEHLQGLSQLQLLSLEGTG